MTGNTKRERMTQKRRQHIFSENCTGHNVAPCCNCGEPIHRYDDEWMIEHKRALGLLGPDNNPNCGPSHVDCGKVKTHTQDLPRIRKAKRQAELLPVGNKVVRVANEPAQGESKKKPARAFQVPAGVVYDWNRLRHVRRGILP